ncbi:MAG: NTP transferase domain-containing protein [Candidatus Delongbacteria bacterium]|nr:NTP transferase domain-containing protein [Candidatus Cloacimonadota bacterium]MCB9474646.1 NTP transferase domain-containing protein [Candidatus Delongbacteria bacterium]
MEHCHAVIMAGGIGSRFWPLSRAHLPKQFLPLLGTRSMLEVTVDRLMPLLPAERVWLVTGALHAKRARHLLPELPRHNTLAEPMGRNTAACLGLAAHELLARDSRAVMLVLPADHFIGDQGRFLATLKRAVAAARDGHLVTIGIRPSGPETGYGYIAVGDDLGGGVHQVKRFTEKPDRETALRFLAGGDHLWNSGMFAFGARTLLDALERWLPETAAALASLPCPLRGKAGREALQQVYEGLRSVSVDVAVMEPASAETGRVLVIPGEFAWSDVGTWREILIMSERDSNGNAVRGNGLLIDSHNCLVHGGERVVALVGMEDTIVVDTPDALLVCRSESHQDVRHVIDRLKDSGQHELL